MIESRTGKIVLAVFGTVLMITFLLPPAVGQMGGGGSAGDVGTVGGRPVTRDHLREASLTLSLANSIDVGGLPLPILAFAEPRLRELSQLAGIFPQEQLADVQQSLLNDAARRVGGLSDDDLTLHLLFRESEVAGGVNANDALGYLLSRDATIRLPNNPQPVRFADIEGEQLRGRYVEATRRVLSIVAASQRYGDVIRVSRPVAERLVAATQQSVSLRVVPVAFDDFVATVADPTPEQLQEQFEAYRDVLPGTFAADNPFGFGYRRPAHVAVEYLHVRRTDAERLVLEQLSAQPLVRRVRDLFAAYTANPARFATPTTQPADAGPQAAPQLPPGGDNLLAAQNAEVESFLAAQADALESEELARWQAFIDVHDEVVRTVVAERTLDLERRAVERATSILSADYAAARASPDASAAVSRQVNVPFGDASYLPAVAASVAGATGLEPEVVRTPLVPVAALASRDVAGPVADATVSAVPFERLVGEFTPDLLDNAGRTRLQRAQITLDLLRAGPVLTNGGGDAFVVRVIRAEAEAPAADLAGVGDAVATDVRRRAALREAESRARQIIAAGDVAAHADALELEAFRPAAGPTGLPDEGPLARLERGDRAALANGVISLLARGPDGRSGTITLPTVGVVLAAEVTDVVPQYASRSEMAQAVSRSRTDAASQFLADAAVLDDFFAADSVARRAGFDAAD